MEVRTYVRNSLTHFVTALLLHHYVTMYVVWVQNTLVHPRNACYDVTHSLCDSFTVASLRNYVGCMGAEYIGES